MGVSSIKISKAASNANGKSTDLENLGLDDSVSLHSVVETGFVRSCSKGGLRYCCLAKCEL